MSAQLLQWQKTKGNLKKEICTINSGLFLTKNQVSKIFAGSSPFGDGELEALDGLPEGFDIPQMTEAPQEYAPGLDKVLKDKAMSTIQWKIKF